MNKWNVWLDEHKRRYDLLWKTRRVYLQVLYRAFDYFLLELQKRYKDFEFVERTPRRDLFTAWHFANLDWPGWEWRNAFDALVELDNEYKWADKRRYGILSPILDMADIKRMQKRMAYWQFEMGEITREEHDETR